MPETMGSETYGFWFFIPPFMYQSNISWMPEAIEEMTARAKEDGFDLVLNQIEARAQAFHYSKDDAGDWVLIQCEDGDDHEAIQIRLSCPATKTLDKPVVKKVRT